jgi:hypothetical protein
MRCSYFSNEEYVFRPNVTSVGYGSMRTQKYAVPPKYVVQTKYTDWKDAGYSLNFLDKHTLYCGEKKFINYFKVESQDPNRIRFHYQCKQWPPEDYQCRDVNTGYNSRGPDNSLAYLDRQDVACAADEGLRKFKVESSGENIRYSFKCCSVKSKK